MSPTESPWLVVVICSIPAAILFSLAVQRQSWRLGSVGGIFVLLAVGAIVADQAVETDREKIERYVVELVRAFEGGHKETALGYLSPNALCERTLIGVAIDMVTVEEPLSIKDVQVDLQNEDSIAISTFRVNGTIQLKGRSAGHQPSQWRMTWQRQADDWKVTRIEELDFIRSTPIDRIKSIGLSLCR